MNDATYRAFPLYGIRITTAYADTDFVALFHRASVVSGNALVEFYKTLPAFVNTDSRHQAIESLDRDISYVLVQTDREDHGERLVDTRTRALEVASVLSLLVLIRTSMNESIGLREHVYTSPWYQHIMVNSRTGVESISSGMATRAWVHTPPTRPIEATQGDVLRWTRHSSCADLARAVLDCDKSIEPPLRQRIAHASIVLYEAINTPTPEMQLLGAITVAEFLVADSNAAKWETIEKRLKVLAGSEHFDQLKPLLQLRHAFVHEGKRCNNGGARLAARLVIGLILSYSRMAANYATHTKFVEHLDYSAHMNRYPVDDSRYEPARSVIVRPPSVWAELVIFDITRSCMSGPDAPTMNQRSEDSSPSFLQARAIVAARMLLQCSVEDAYLRVIDALTYDRPAWSAQAEFLSFYNARRDHIDEKASRAAASYRKHGPNQVFT